MCSSDLERQRNAAVLDGESTGVNASFNWEPVSNIHQDLFKHYAALLLFFVFLFPCTLRLFHDFFNQRNALQVLIA